MAELTIIGSNSALPAHHRHPSAQYLRIGQSNVLIDCGDGTQFRLFEEGVSPVKLTHIFISHLHGDHVFGLPGLLTSMVLLSRQLPLVVYGPAGIKSMIKNYLESSYFHASFEITFIETDPTLTSVILDTDEFSVQTIPLSHKIPCNGYLFREKSTALNIRKELIGSHKLTVDQIIALKSGQDVETPLGRLHPAQALYQKTKPGSYAYCSDTIYLPENIKLLKGIDLLYHEATYLHEWHEKSRERGHTTAYEAGLLARDAGVGKLLIGHPSSKYKNIDALLSEAQSVFPNTSFAAEGSVWLL